MTINPEYTSLADRLFFHYEDYREGRLSHRRFKHHDILSLLAPGYRKGFWEIVQAGRSFEGRSIHLLKAGRGSVKVLLWSQMHGDEATATMALFDIFNFLEGRGDGFDVFREALLENLTLYFVPMLNPDGAERFQRATAQTIDMNRDALALQTPEARLLKALVKELKPDFGFNLHDQNPRYTAGRSANLAAISFLATSYDYELSVNDTRLRSMQLIAHLNEVLQRFIPGQVGRFSDDHEPRAFGDNIQKWGTSLVLIESGGYRGDIEKQFVRKLNFVTLLSAFAAIADSACTTMRTQAEYEAIPRNHRSVYDLVIRGVSVRLNEKVFSLDIGIDREEVNNEDATGFYYKATIGEAGDLQTCFGAEELAAEGLQIVGAAMYPQVVTDREKWNEIDFWKGVRDGYGYIRVSGPLKKELTEEGAEKWPVQLLDETESLPGRSLEVGSNPAFFLAEEGKLRYAVINGFVFNLGKG